MSLKPEFTAPFDLTNFQKLLGFVLHESATFFEFAVLCCATLYEPDYAHFCIRLELQDHECVNISSRDDAYF